MHTVSHRTAYTLTLLLPTHTHTHRTKTQHHSHSLAVHDPSFLLLTSRSCGSRRSRSDGRSGLAGAAAGSSRTNCTDACLRGASPGSSWGSPVCCPPVKMVGTALVQPLFSALHYNIWEGGFSRGVCSARTHTHTHRHTHKHTHTHNWFGNIWCLLIYIDMVDTMHRCWWIGVHTQMQKQRGGIADERRQRM